MKGNKNIRSNWKGSRERDPQVMPVMLCACLLFLAMGILFPHLLPDSQGSAGDPVIEFSEIMISNTAACPAPNGNYYPWVELVNSSNETIDCSDLRLASSIDIRGAVQLPSTQLLSGERVLVYLTNDTIPGAATCPVKTGKRVKDLYLFDGKGHVVKALNIPSMGKNHSCIFDPATNEWTETALYTPGEENTEAGYARVLQNLTAPETLYINKAVASNRESLITQSGEKPDWIELYNPGSTAFDLSGWYLTDDLCDRRKFMFPSGTSVGANDILIVCATETPLTDYITTDFRLSTKNGGVYLIDPMGRCVSALQWKKLRRDESASRDESDTASLGTAAPGASDAVQYITENNTGIYINEVMCASATTNDWIELYNASNSSVDLSGWYLSKKNSDPLMWSFPSGTGIEAGGYLVVVLNKTGTLPASAPARSVAAPMTLSLDGTVNGGKHIILSAPSGEEIDHIKLVNQRANVSYGRAFDKNTYRYFAEPTPGSPNASVSYGSAGTKVRFSQTGGLRSSGPVTLEMISNGAPIYYTTDGTTPTANSAQYTGPLTIDSNCVISAVTAGSDAMISEPVCRTFVFGRETTLRTVCVTGDRNQLISSDGVLNTGSKTMLPVQIEIYDYDGSLMVEQSCAFQLAGSNSRRKYPQKAFKLKARSGYGGGKFYSKLFTRRDYTQFDSIVLRASGQDMKETHMRDSVLTALAADTSVMYQETELACVFIDGEYWGCYNMRENLNRDSICQFEGWDPNDADDLDIFAGSDMGIVQGSKDTFNQLLKFVRENDMSSDANFATVSEMLDIDNYIDYMCLLIYTEHEDLGNIMGYRNPNTDGKWRWAIYDLDFAFTNDKNTLKMWLSGDSKVGTITPTDGTLFYRLFKNASFRDRFYTRMGQLLATSLSSSKVQTAILTRFHAISDEMVYSCDRWGVKYETFRKLTNKLFNYAGTRTKKMIGYIKETCNLSDADVQKYFGAAIENENASPPIEFA